MGRIPAKSCLLTFFFTGAIKPSFQQSGNLPVEVISLKSTDKGSERMSAKTLISAIGMSSGQVLHFLMFLIFCLNIWGQNNREIGWV